MVLGLGNSIISSYTQGETLYTASASWDFDGTDDHVNLGDADAIRGNVTDTSEGTGLSVGVWFLIDDIQTNTSVPENIVSSRQYPGGWEIMMANTRVNWKLKYASGSSADILGGWRTLGTSASPLRASGWHHTGFTFDGRYMKAYLNGSQYGSAVDTGSDDNIIYHGSSSQGADVLIGADPGTNSGTSGNSSGTVHFEGLINEVAMWSGILDEDAWSEIFEAVNTDGAVLDLTKDSGDYDYSSTLTGLYRASDGISSTTATNIANPGTSNGTIKNSLGTSTTVPS